MSCEKSWLVVPEADAGQHMSTLEVFLILGMCCTGNSGIINSPRRFLFFVFLLVQACGVL